MRRVLIALLVANILAFFWWRGYLDGFLGSAREPDRVASQVGAERLQIVPLTRLQPGAKPSLQDTGDSCIELGPLEEPRAARVRDFAESAGKVIRISAEPIENLGVWMVYTVPADSLASAQRRLADLQKSGVQDIYLMQDGVYRNSISFGLFRFEDSAKSLVENLTKQGVKGVKIVQRSASEPKTVFQLRLAPDVDALAPGVRDRLSALTTELGLNPVSCHSKP